VIIILKIILSNSSQEPLYEQIVRQIKGNVVKGYLKPGDSLPSIRSLAKELEISVITTKRSYEELEREGFIQTIPGKGSFVSSENQEFLREKRYRDFEDQLRILVKEAREMGLALQDLYEIITIFYEESDLND
jgi:GntR family transcriptional regulator